MPVKIKDVAKLAGVSTATVSYVINNTQEVREETKKRVFDAMNELNYVPNRVARSLRNQKSAIIGFLLPDISNFFFSEVARGISAVLDTNGYQMLIGDSGEDVGREIKKIETFASHNIDGLILASTAGGYSEISGYIKEKFPVVCIDRKPKGYSGDSVLSANFSGMFEAVSWLAAKGRNRIGFISGYHRLSSSSDRFEGYKRALVENSLPFTSDLVGVGDGRETGGYLVASQLIPKGVDALVVANNLMTIGAILYCKEHGKRIPEDVAVIGFDDYSWAEITNPPISVIKQNPYDIGAKAAELIVRRIQAPDEVVQNIVLKTEMVLRSSG